VGKLLLDRGDKGAKRQFLTKDEIVFLIDGVTEVLKTEGTLAEVDPPVVICGDTHGQFFDLLRLFDHGGWPPESRYLFLGDYVDRGAQSIEVICLMFAFKMAHPDDFHLLRGNHECMNINRVYGFFDECKRRYTEDLYWKFNSAFEWLPLAGLVGGRILCMHGGLSPDLHNLDQIRHTHRPIRDVDGGMVADLLWSDPAPNIRGFVPNNRGISFKFGADAVIDICNKLGLDMVVRAHQVVMEGYDFFADDRLVTLFSAPKYCDQFDNAAAMMIVDGDLTCRIKQLTL